MVRQQVIVLPACDAAGKVFADFNNNGLYDGNEIGLENILVSSSSGAFTTTNLKGDYYFASLPAGDTIRPEVNISGVNVSPAYYLNQVGNETNLDFAVSGSFGPPDVSIFLNNVQVFRRGFNTNIIATVQNNSWEAQSNVELKMLLPPFLILQNSTPAASYQIGDTLFWSIGTLFPGDFFSVNLETYTPASTAFNTAVVVYGWVTPLDDLDPSNNFYKLSKVVLGSFDPNDKQVDPAFVTPAMLADRSRLEYTIRFQNTGNYPADFVKIIDTLQANLEPASFQLIASSHPCSWKLTSPGILEFLFSNIDLPDSLSNEPASHGFVSFSLQPRRGLDIGDQVENFSDIYFDFNPPVRTNTAGTQVVYFLPGEPPGGGSMDARPNPANYVIHLGWASPLPEEGFLRIFTVTGLPVRETTVAAGSSGIDVYVADLPNGLYYALLEAGAQRFVKQFIVQHSGGPVRRMRK